MGLYITVKFIGKEYSIPEDILTYIDLLDFTDSVQKQLASAFVRKLRNELYKGNFGRFDDKVIAPDIEQQVGKFIAKLTEHGIYNQNQRYMIYHYFFIVANCTLTGY